MENSNLDFTINLADVESSTPGKQGLESTTASSASTAPMLQAKQAPTERRGSQSACSILTVDYWREYFDVTEGEIISKVRAGLNPTNNAFEQLIDQKVDLYGPFWISTTLIFAMIVAPRLWQVLLFQSSTFDISKIGFAFTLIYGGLAAFTFVFYGMSKFMGTSAPIFRTAAIYGYSYSVFLLAAFGAILAVPFIKFILALGAGFHSVLFLLRNFKPSLEKLDASNRLLVVAFICLMQLFMTLMIYFQYLK